MGVHMYLSCLECKVTLCGLGKLGELTGNVIDMLRVVDFMDTHREHPLVFYGDSNVPDACANFKMVDHIDYGAADYRELNMINPARALYAIMTVGDEYDRRMAGIYYKPSVIKEMEKDIQKAKRERRRRRGNAEGEEGTQK